MQASTRAALLILSLSDLILSLSKDEGWRIYGSQFDKLTVQAHHEETAWPTKKSGPFPPAKYRNPLPVLGNAVNIDVTRPDHPVDMDLGRITALFFDLLGRDAFCALETLGVTLAQRDVAGSVFVK